MSIYYTIQTTKAWEKAKEVGYLIGNPQCVLDDFQESYAWMITQMNKRIRHDGSYPIWLWLSLPDLKQEAHLQTGEYGVCLTVEIPDEDVLVSHFDAWHCILNNWFCSFTEAEDEAYDRGVVQLTKEESWERIFLLDAFKTAELWQGSEESLQGVTGKIELTQVINAIPFIAK